MLLHDQYALASRARTKLLRCAKDAQRANKEYNLRVLVGHANMLDKITESVEHMQASGLQLSRQPSRPEPVGPADTAGLVDTVDTEPTHYYYSSGSESESESETESESESESESENESDTETPEFTYDKKDVYAGRTEDVFETEDLQLCTREDKSEFKESTEVCSGSDSDEHIHSTLDDNDAFKTSEKLNNLQLQRETLV